MPIYEHAHYAPKGKPCTLCTSFSLAQFVYRTPYNTLHVSHVHEADLPHGVYHAPHVNHVYIAHLQNLQNNVHHAPHPHPLPIHHREVRQALVTDTSILVHTAQHTKLSTLHTHASVPCTKHTAHSKVL